MFCALIFLACAAGDTVLVNGDFAQGVDGWIRAAAPEILIGPSPDSSAVSVQITVPETAAPGYPNIHQRFDVTPGTLVDARVDIKTHNIRRGNGGYAAVEFYDDAGNRISFGQSDAATPENQWVPIRVRATAPPGSVTSQFCLLLNGTGDALFSNASVRLSQAPAPGPLTGPVTITVKPERACDSFKGFGAEDDGWFYNDNNREHGVDEADIALREERIRWMDPDWQRMFFWYKDWNPSGDWETFDFDTPNMRSHYRTLDLYQQMGATVNVVGVEWGVKHPYGDVEKAARGIVALLEHLVKAKGYTCVQEWTLTNEPNGSFIRTGSTFEDYVRLHVLVKEELVRRELPIRILGSDDTNGLAWFTACVNNGDYFGAADCFVSHRYIPFGDRDQMAYFVEDRMALLEAKTPRKPFAVAEFGFQDGRSGTLENPLMEEYRYAVWTQAFVLEALNRGVAGFCVWCLHETYYPSNGFMNYGLWNYKDRGWQVRPVYHAWAAFCRLTEPGDPVYRCESSVPAHVLAARIGDVLFWVNRGDEPAEVHVRDMTLSTARIMTEATLQGDRECGTEGPLQEGAFTAPPQSFGYAR